jgi:hypothetical protein
MRRVSYTSQSRFWRTPVDSLENVTEGVVDLEIQCRC